MATEYLGENPGFWEGSNEHMLGDREVFLEDEKSSQALNTGKMSPGGEHFSGTEVQKVCLGVWLEQKICDRQRKEKRLEYGRNG